MRGFEFGHAVYEVREGRRYMCRYVDTGELVCASGGTLYQSRYRGTRPCAACGRFRTEEGHDPCIANLPGVLAACCGHGVEEGYVKFSNGLVIRGKWEFS